MADGADCQFSRGAERGESRMSLFLASVTSVEEARIALESGADVIDLKNPVQGALGALPVATIKQITQFIAGRKLVSATAGDPPMRSDILRNAVLEIAAAGVDVVKIGFSASSECHQCVQELQSVTEQGIKLIAVLLVDKAIASYALEDFALAGFYGVMLDTATKNGKGLRYYLSLPDIADFVEQAHGMALVAGLAGSLQCADIAPLAALSPDYMGFRGALCMNLERTACIEAQRMQKVRDMLR